MSRHKKSSRREMSDSSDENSSEKVIKHKYHSSDAHRRSEKYKKTEKSSKYRSPSSSDSNDDYDPRKQNKTSKRYKKKTSKRSKEKLSDGSEDESFRYQEQRRSEKRDNRYENEVSSERFSYISESSKKRSKGQEKQRYGKWTENSDRDKVSRSYDEQRSYRAKKMDDYESLPKDYTKHSKRSPIPDKYENSRHSRYSKQFDESGSKSDEAMDCDSSRNKLKRKKETEAKTIDDGDNGSLRTNIELEVSEKNDVEPLSKRSKIQNINMRTGGAYIPPAKLKMMQDKIKDKNSEEYQRIAWEALKKSIVGMTNKVNSSNITEIVRELFKENIIRGRGVLVRAIMQAQAASPTFTKVYASLVSVINSKFPEIGDLLLNRLIMQYKRGFRRKDKITCLTAARFLAHLFNQDVVHEILIFEIVAHLMYTPTEDFVEIAIAVLKECGKKLTQESPKAMRATTQTVRDALHAGTMDMRTQYMIEVYFAIQKDQFKDFETVSKELDLVEEEDKYTHDIKLDDPIDVHEMLNVFKFDPEYLDIEEKYKAVVREILGDSDDEDGDSGDESDSEGEDENDEETKEDSQKIIDMTETNIVCLRRKIYLTIQSSLDFEECAHKLLKLELKPGQILEMCYMILDCCAQQRSYEKFFGLLAQRFCQINKVYVEPFTQIFENSYKTIHRLETNKLRNVAKFFAHLLYTDAISWTVLAIIKLNEEDTTSSSRIFIKVLFQELCEYMGLPKLNERVKDVTLQEAFDGLFPRDHPHNTRFAINFFTSIGLGGLTDELREHLKNLPKTTQNTQQQKPLSSSSASSSSSSSSSSED